MTIVLTAPLLRAGPGLLDALERLPRIGILFAEPVGGDPGASDFSGHAVICGYGRIGRELVDALAARGIGYVVIEYNPHVVRELRARGVATIYGDAANAAVLEHAHVERARLLAVLVPDRTVCEQATRVSRALNRRLDIVARAGSVGDLERLRQAGATEVVQPEFEVGVEVVRHSLRRFGIGGMELTSLIAGRRATFYRAAAADRDLGR